MITLLWLVGCTPPAATAPSPRCPSGRPDTVVVDELACAARQLDGGTGELVDTWMASPSLRAVVRHPEASRSLAGLGGGTVVDIAPWDAPDVAYEWAPLIGGGWLDVDAVERESDAVVVTGRVRSLPDRRVPEGAPATVRYRLDPDLPVLHIEGADGLWLHPLPGVERLGAALLGTTQVVTDATAIEDLGGALRLDGVRRVAVAPLGQPDAWLDHETAPVEINVPGASTLALRTSEGVVRAPLVNGALSGALPAEVEALRVEAPGHAASNWVSLSDTDALALGPPGRVELTVNAPLRGPIAVHWEHEDGRHGTGLVRDGRVQLDTGAGVVQLRSSAGDRLVTAEALTAVLPGQVTRARLNLPERFDTEYFAAVRVMAPSERDRGTRTATADLLRASAAEGFAVTVFTPRDDLDEPVSLPGLPSRAGLALRGDDGAGVYSWSHSPHRRRAAHGAPSTAGVASIDLVPLARLGADERYVMVDQAYLAAVDPSESDVFDLAYVSDYDGALDFFAWVDAGHAISPAGPTTWVRAPAPEQLMAIEFERQVVRRSTIASSEGWLDLRVGGAAPGYAPDPFRQRELRLDIGTGGDLTEIELWLDGELWHRAHARELPLRLDLPLRARWVAAVATGPDDFALTAPFWLQPTPRDDAGG